MLLPTGLTGLVIESSFSDSGLGAIGTRSLDIERLWECECAGRERRGSATSERPEPVVGDSGRGISVDTWPEDRE